MAKAKRRTRDELRENMRTMANRTRDTADEMALMFGGCDDPLHPLLDLKAPWNNWLEFTEMVARPLVDAEDDEAAVQKAMAAYRMVNPYYICAALVMAANRLAEAEDVASD